jgi:hypothetical protein
MMEDFNNWGIIAEQFSAACEDAVEQTAKDGVTNVQQQIRRNNQVITGLMHDSTYMRTYYISTYGAFPGEQEKRLLPEVDRPEDRWTAYFAVPANYAWFPNYGTRFQRANPFWDPSIDKTREQFEQHLSDIEVKLH